MHYTSMCTACHRHAPVLGLTINSPAGQPPRPAGAAAAAAAAAGRHMYII
eukprot:COSAG01_NODE_29007_length_647_cov_2.414234_1_plen_49_part_10